MDRDAVLAEVAALHERDFHRFVSAVRLSRAAGPGSATGRIEVIKKRWIVVPFPAELDPLVEEIATLSDEAFKQWILDVWTRREPIVRERLNMLSNDELLAQYTFNIISFKSMTIYGILIKRGVSVLPPQDAF
jgi:hypothetical protein